MPPVYCLRRETMFTSNSNEGFAPALPGIERKTLVYGELTLATEFRMKGGSTLPMHKHPFEQTGYLVTGRVRLTIDGDSFTATAGASWCIPSDAVHGAEILEDSVAIEIFSPVRADYLPARDP
jgi:quercetin dioxygenase-like cupin family protein